MGYLEQSNTPGETEKPKKIRTYSDVREMHREILLNTFHASEVSDLPDLAPSLPPDASMVLFAQSLHKAHARVRVPTIGQRVWQKITPSGRLIAATALPEAQRHAAIASSVLETHAQRMTRDHGSHNQEFHGRMPGDQSLLMETMAHVLHTEESEWKPRIDDAREKMLAHVDATAYEHRLILARVLSQLHVVSHRASDQIRELCGNRQLELPSRNVDLLRRSASQLSTLCLRLQQWEYVDPCQIKKNFVMDMRLFDGDWHR